MAETVSVSTLPMTVELPAPPSYGPDIPLPMSFPAILRDPSSRYAHLHAGPQKGRVRDASGEARAGSSRIEGKRKTLRRENSRFLSNPHAVPPTRSDYDAPLASVRSTFPVPLPPYLPRTQLAPSPTPPQRDEPSAYSGRFSMSLRGARKDLRRRGLHAERMVRVVESELVRWLGSPGEQTLDRPFGVELAAPIDEGYNACLKGSVVEVWRTPMKLVWKTDDALARYVVHCTARWHNVVSFSKDLPSGERHTTLLRPNVFGPHMTQLASLSSEPAQGAPLPSPALETDTDALSSTYDSEAWSHVDRPRRVVAASVTGESATDLTDDVFSAVAESSDAESSAYLSPDVDMMSEDERSLAEHAEDMAPAEGDDDTPQPGDIARSLNRMSLAERQRLRSRSSPSPSPVRRRPRPGAGGRTGRAGAESPVGRDMLPELERRRPGKPPARAQSFFEHVFR